MLELDRLLEAFLHLLWCDVDDRAAVAVQLLDLLELAHDLFLAHGIDRAVPNLLAIDVDRSKSLPAAVLRLHRGAIRSRGQGLVTNDL